MPGTILVVDDHPAALAGVTEILADAGYETLGAGTYESATRLLEEIEPDLLIADVRLGDENGIGLVIHGRARHPGLGVMMVTGFPDPVLEREARRHGAVAFLIKPLAPDAFLESVAETLRTTGRRRRWFRRSMKPPVEAIVNQHQVKIVCMSHGGAKLEIPSSTESDLPEAIQLQLPLLGIVVPAARVWTRQAEGAVLCGVAIDSTSPGAEAWFGLVDSLFRADATS